MKSKRIIKTKVPACIRLAAVLGLLAASAAEAGVTVFFNTNQVATLIASETNSDTIRSGSYLFTYTLDKLFTGGVGMTIPIGRYVAVPWPQGITAQAITTGPLAGKAKMTIKREDSALFNMPNITFTILANTAGAGATLEIMPLLNGEDGLPDPVIMDATGYAGKEFSYNTSANYLGSTAALVNFDEYKITLYVDFALTALTLVSSAPEVNHAPTDVLLSTISILENEPVGTPVGTFSTTDSDTGDTFSYALVSGIGSTNNGLFSISQSTLLTAASFNYEVQSNYSVRVQSTDQGGLTTQKVFNVSIVDANETPALFGIDTSQQGRAIIRWSSVTNHIYTLHVSTNLQAGFSVLTTNIMATPSMNTYTDSVQNAEKRFWKVSTIP